MEVRIEESWKIVLENEFNKDYFKTLTEFVRNEYNKRQIFPPPSKIFNAFDLCPFNDTKVIILGQDPYHDVNQANGLCFSVNDEIKQPPSLVNIFKEIENDLGVPAPQSGNLERWAKQGVLLLNATLTVRAHQAGSHQNMGWETFTNSVIKILANQREHIVFLLWGAYAIQKSSFIDYRKHLVLTSPHPSLLSAHRGFFGNKHFSKANEYLKSKGIKEISW